MSMNITFVQKLFDLLITPHNFDDWAKEAFCFLRAPEMECLTTYYSGAISKERQRAYRGLDVYLGQLCVKTIETRPQGSLGYLLRRQVRGEVKCSPRLSQISERLKTRAAVDYRKIIGDNRRVFFGELHDSQVMADEMIALMPLLQDLGFALAMEDFSSQLQPILDGFRDGLFSKEELMKAYYFFHLHGKSSFSYLSFFDIAVAAAIHGVRIVGIEASTHELNQVCKEVDANGYGSLQEEELSRIVFDRSHPLHVYIAGRTFYRNYHAAKVLASCNSRYAVLGGQGHYGYQEGLAGALTLNGILDSMGHDCGPVIYFSDFLKSRKTRGVSQSTREVAVAAQRLGIGKERFMLNADSSLPGLRPDIVVHLPQPYRENS